MAQTLTPDDLDALAERIPPLVDVDAHVVEPADVWSSRLPAKYRDIGPHIEYHPAGRPVLAGGTYIEEPGTSGPDVAWWFYEDHRCSVKRLIAAAGTRPATSRWPASPSTRCAQAVGSRRRASPTWTSTAWKRRSAIRTTRVSRGRSS